MKEMDVIVSRLMAKTLGGEIKWSYFYGGDGYICDTTLSDGTKVGIVHLNNFFDVLSHANIIIHTPDGNILTSSINGYKCASFIKAIVKNPLHVNKAQMAIVKDNASMERILDVLKR